MCKQRTTLEKIHNFTINNFRRILFIMLIISFTNIFVNSQKEDCTKQSLEQMSSISCLQLKAMDAHVSRMGYSMNKIEDHLCVLENLTKDNFEVCLKDFKIKNNYYHNKTNETTNEYTRYLAERERRFNAYNETQDDYVIWDGFGQFATIVLIVLNLLIILIEKNK